MKFDVVSVRNRKQTLAQATNTSIYNLHGFVSISMYVVTEVENHSLEHTVESYREGAY